MIVWLAKRLADWMVVLLLRLWWLKATQAQQPVPATLVWTKPMVSEFLNLYSCEVVFAQKSNTGFPDSSHKSVACQIRMSYPAVGHVKDTEIFKSKLRTMMPWWPAKASMDLYGMHRPVR
jgi:hypothetical protein